MLRLIVNYEMCYSSVEAAEVERRKLVAENL